MMSDYVIILADAAMSVLIEWSDGWLPPDETRHEIEAVVRKDLEENDFHPETLIFHPVFLNNDGHGPVVLVYGHNGAFHCKYDSSGVRPLGMSE